MKAFWCYIFVLLAAPFLAYAFAFNQKLKMGSTGQPVFELQLALNRDPDTKVALTGPGSPGLESAYFGRKTFEAVKRFQTKYRGEVLSPLGLSEATGVVGAATRKKLTELSSASVKPLSQTPPTPAAPANPGTAPFLPSVPPNGHSSSGIAPTNPNFVNLDKFIADVEKVGRRKGYSESKLDALAGKIKMAAATTTDFRAEFAKAWSKAKPVSKSRPLPPRPLALGSFFKNLFIALGILPVSAKAQAGAPFGGAIYYVFLCDCSGDWLVGVEPLPPSFVTLLSYYEGTQAFASYNAPFTTELLGDYEPGAGICLEVAGPDCFDIPSEGMITSFLGSSGL